MRRGVRVGEPGRAKASSEDLVGPWRGEFRSYSSERFILTECDFLGNPEKYSYLLSVLSKIAHLQNCRWFVIAN